MAAIFMSYRRTDASTAQRLSDSLSLRFGRDVVWRDTEDLVPGDRWLPTILDEISDADVVLIVIGKHWRDDDTGANRFDDPADVLLLEVTTALEAQKVVIPVLLPEGTVPAASELPTTIRDLAAIEAAQLRDGHWGRDIEVLMEVLREHVEPSRERMRLGHLQTMVVQWQDEYLRIRSTDPTRAAALTAQTLSLLDEQMPLYPHNQFLQLLRAYSHKNEAMTRRDQHDHEGFGQHLALAERYFTAIVRETRRSFASAVNGVGSVRMLQGRFEDALAHIDQALQLEPTYPAARRDRETALRRLEKATREAALSSSDGGDAAPHPRDARDP